MAWCWSVKFFSKKHVLTITPQSVWWEYIYEHNIKAKRGKLTPSHLYKSLYALDNGLYEIATQLSNSNRKVKVDCFEADSEEDEPGLDHALCDSDIDIPDAATHISVNHLQYH
jgi:hypothetical protein